MQMIPLLDVPSQTVRASLGGQSCAINVYTRGLGMFCDLYVSDVLIVGGVACQNINRIVRNVYLGFAGDLVFLDTQGKSDPSSQGLGSRFVLMYLTAAEAGDA